MKSLFVGNMSFQTTETDLRDLFKDLGQVSRIQMITDRGPFVLLDIGATTDSSGLNLAQYAQMGAIYAERVLDVQNPSVALLSIGEEGGKGEQPGRAWWWPHVAISAALLMNQFEHDRVAVLGP